ncbi:MAG TPA: GNAT family N-acetyltransferase [Acidimicrobiales bacterium]|nr:GNAT family N-acetyltransferase [Acidimicrobiales bacterium]
MPDVWQNGALMALHDEALGERMRAEFIIRPRQPEDLEALLPMAVRIKEVDNYPEALASTDPQELCAFLEAGSPYGAWVAVPSTARPEPGALSPIAGHVVLSTPRPGAVTDVIRRQTGLEPAAIGMVARLVVVPDWRGRGVGRALLRTATDEARRRGLLPALDTLVSNVGARSLYESEGWRALGTARTQLAWGHELDQLVYSAP